MCVCVFVVLVCFVAISCRFTICINDFDVGGDNNDDVDVDVDNGVVLHTAKKKIGTIVDLGTQNTLFLILFLSSPRVQTLLQWTVLVWRLEEKDNFFQIETVMCFDE